MIQANIHLVKNRLAGHIQNARTWANNPALCSDPVCTKVMNEHCERLDSVVSMLGELERMVTVRDQE